MLKDNSIAANAMTKLLWEFYLSSKHQTSTNQVQVDTNLLSIYVLSIIQTDNSQKAFFFLSEIGQMTLASEIKLKMCWIKLKVVGINCMKNNLTELLKIKFSDLFYEARSNHFSTRSKN